MTDDTPRRTPAGAGDETQPVRPVEASSLPPAPATPAAGADPAAAPAAVPTPAAGPDPAGGPVTPSYAAPEAYAAPGRRGFGERLRSLGRSDGSRAFGLGALIASALAGVIVGGIGTATFHAVTDDRGPGDRFGQHGPMGRDGLGERPGPGGDLDGDGDRQGDRGPMFGGPGVPGQVQPTTPPEDDDSAS